MASAEVIPNPDPSSKTDEAIDRAVNNAKQVIDARINGIEKGIEVFQTDLTRVPTTVDRQISALRELLDMRINGVDHDMVGIHANLDKRDRDIESAISHLRDLVLGKIQELASVTTERFLGVAAQFSERDTRTDQRAGDTKLAVDAAFAAAKETTAKTETNFTKQIDAMLNIIDTKTANLAGGIGDLKERMTAMESRTQGIGAANTESRNNQNDNRGLVFGIIGIAIGVAAMLVTILTHIIK